MKTYLVWGEGETVDDAREYDAHDHAEALALDFSAIVGEAGADDTVEATLFVREEGSELVFGFRSRREVLLTTRPVEVSRD